jgi:hypothetical protein
MIPQVFIPTQQRYTFINNTESNTSYLSKPSFYSSSHNPILIVTFLSILLINQETKMMAPVGHDNTENNWGCRMVTAPSKIPAKSTKEFKHLVAASIPGFHLMGLYGSGSNANAAAINCATGPHGHTEECLIGCGSYVSATFEEGDLSYLSTNDPRELNYALSMIGADKSKLDERARNQIIALPYCIPPSASLSSLEMDQWNTEMDWLEQKVSRAVS